MEITDIEVGWLRAGVELIGVGVVLGPVIGGASAETRVAGSIPVGSVKVGLGGEMCAEAVSAGPDGRRLFSKSKLFNAATEVVMEDVRQRCGAASLDRSGDA